LNQKILLTKSYYLSTTYKEIVQNSKSEPKKMLNLEYLYPQVEEGLGCLTGAPGACVLTCLDLRLVGQLDSQVARSIRLWQEAHRQVVINHKNSQAITDWLALNSSDGQ
jgi:hypothetical protein